MPTLVIQKGHCYRRTGATGTNGEQDFATRVAGDCALLLSRNGWTVRVILADEATSSYRGDAFVAIHADGSTNTSVRGASTGYRTPEGQAFGQAWKRAYEARGWPGGFRPDNYTVALAQYYGTGNAVAQGNRRAIIVECGFLTSPDDRAVLQSTGSMSGTNRVALAIGDALGITAGTTTAPAPPQQGEDVLTPDDGNTVWASVNIYTGQPEKKAVADWLGETNSIVRHIVDEQAALNKRLDGFEAALADLKSRPAADVDEQVLADLMVKAGVAGVTVAQMKQLLGDVHLSVGRPTEA